LMLLRGWSSLLVLGAWQTTRKKQLLCTVTPCWVHKYLTIKPGHPLSECRLPLQWLGGGACRYTTTDLCSVLPYQPMVADRLMRS
jgi:hypothetical protein